ncbi:MAG: galactose mutarotase [Candidatus Pedobacter colombiensis]|uniref:Aldose 1-epimerase n=1 Tax=Candidatus Pedobacter colombiensis TaxID=3121371 RepID=A0AAJ6B807_9SPHI|nr:aldose epimerase family protein [Pedobacter sp.]WEK20419.1 MAG: galactose mutarotase [Pedobacter sp.]
MKTLKITLKKISLIWVALLTISCHNKKQQAADHTVVSIQNKEGMIAQFCANGARLMSLKVPDKSGKLTDVVVGFENPVDYDKSTEPYFGATIGRYGNRIAGGRFSLDGDEPYQLSINNGINALHGGKTGFQYQNWALEKLNDSTLVCRLESLDGDNGFPGKLAVEVTYMLLSSNALHISYEARTDRPTIVNLTNHAFFNLNGSGSILDHQLMINANRYTPVDRTLIPTGELALVKGTPFDFRSSETIGKRINEANEQLRFGKGYDHNYVLNKSMPAAVVCGEKSGIVMAVYTDQPGLQFYSGNFMQGKNELRNGPDLFRTAFCLETQHFPDSPNHPDFPSTVLRPGEVYQTQTVYAFSTDK